MKTSYNWLNRHIDLHGIDKEKLGEILTSLGLEVEGTEAYSSIPGGLEGVTVGKVLTCEKHPDADKLQVTQVDVGAEEPLQIVCGAPNVAAGQTVAVANVGTVLYAGGEEFTIKKAKIRGVASFGMICAEDELCIGDSHDGIMVLPDTYIPGTALSDYIDAYEDYVYDIGLTPNRSDATHHRGVAKDLLAYLSFHSDENYKLKPLETSLPAVSDELEIDIQVENRQDCPRYAGLIIDDVEIKESPLWMQNLLKSIGLRPINNIVDTTNFILHDMGQPLHAFDYDKIQGHEIRVKHLPEGTEFTTLDGNQISLSEKDLMICDGEDNGLCIAGVYGGQGSGVTEETKRIFLESAHFNAESVRRSSMKHFLRTDAAKVFEKGSDPSIVLDALKKATHLLVDLCGGKVASEIKEFYPEEIQAHEIQVRYKRVTSLIGKELSAEEIKGILKALNMELVSESKEAVTVHVPTDKNEVLREVDIIEEILRIYGFEQVEVDNRSSGHTHAVHLPEAFHIKQDVSKILQANGFLEMMNVSLTDSSRYSETDELIYINNTSNQNLDILRPDMYVSALETAAYNINHKQQNFAFYEWGFSYRHADGDYEEKEALCLMISGLVEEENWKNKAAIEADFYSLKAFVELILHRLGITGFQESRIEDDEVLSYGLKYHRGPIELVKYGKVKASEAEDYGIEQEIYVAIYDWKNIMKNIPSKRMKYVPINKYPSIHRDLALIVDKSVAYEDIVRLVRKQLKQNLVDVHLFDIYEDDALFGEGRHSLAIRMELQDKKKTMTDKQVEAMMSKLIQALKKKLDIELR